MKVTPPTKPAEYVWRPGGTTGGAAGLFSTLLANPEFRKQFLARLREICSTIFTEEKAHHSADSMTTQEMHISAEAHGKTRNH